MAAGIGADIEFEGELVPTNAQGRIGIKRSEKFKPINVAGLKIAHLAKINLAVEFLVLILTVPGLRGENIIRPTWLEK